MINKNICVFNSMPGSNKEGFLKCTCGYSKDINSDITTCPSCGAIVTVKDFAIALGNNLFHSRKIQIKTFNNNFYCFDIYLYKNAGYYTISYSKAEIRKIVVAENEILKIRFDSFNKGKVLSFYNNGEEITKKEFITAFENLNINLYSFSMHDNSFNVFGKELNLNHYHDRNSIYSNLNSLLLYLERKKEYCEEPYREILIKAGIDPSNIQESFINKNGTSPTEILKLKPYSIKKLKELQNNTNVYLVIKKIEKELGDKYVEFYNTFLETQSQLILSENKLMQLIKLITIGNIPIKKLYKYIYEEAPIKQGLYTTSETLNLLSDSLDMCNQLELPFDKKPAALIRYHDTLTSEIHIIEDALCEQKIKSIGEDYKTFDEINITYNEDIQKEEITNEYSIIVAKEAQEIIQEGRSMHHCVGSYLKIVADRSSLILFLRRTDNLDKPFATLEYKPDFNSIVQVKGFSNSSVDKSAKDYLKQWAKRKGINISNYH